MFDLLNDLNHPVLVATNVSQLEEMVAMETTGSVIIPKTRIRFWFYFGANQICDFPQHTFMVIAKWGFGHFGM